MKRSFLILTAILITVAYIAPSAHAFDSDEFSNAVSYTCTLDEATGKIVVDGTVHHDVMMKYPSYKIRLYAIAPGERLDDVISDTQRSPLAETVMTIKFTFSIPVKSSLERYSKYAVIFCSEDGEQYVAGTPKYPAVSSDFEYLRGDRGAYKGVLCDSSALSFDVGASMVVIDVDMSKMRGDISDAILYPSNGEYLSFSRTYVEGLDKQINSASVNGAKIYLRFLLSATDKDLCVACMSDGDKRGFPNIYDEYTLGYISSISKFLMERYTEGIGKISGVIVGDRADDIVNTNYVGDMSAEQYADAYVLYLTVVAGAMRMTDSTLDIVIPVSDRDEYSENKVEQTTTSDFLNRVISELEYGTSGRFKCSVMIQSDVVPFGINNLNISEGVDLEAQFASGEIHAGNVKSFADHIRKLSGTYVSAPSNIIFMWEPPADLGGSALHTAYAYIYYKLYAEADISSFVINVCDSEQLLQLANTVSFIDTQHGSTVTSDLLKYFNKNTWSDVIGADINEDTRETRFEFSAVTGVTPQSYKSSFVYYTFADYDIFNNTYLGVNGKSIYSTPDSLGKRSLQLRTESLDIGHSADCTYILDYIESFKYTPIIALTVGLDEARDDSSALYELRLTLGTDASVAVCKAVIGSGTTQTLFFDVSAFAANYTADYVRVSIRPLTEASGGCTLRIYDLCGYSDTYSGDELEELITEQRNALRNTGTVGENEVQKTIITVICIIVALVAISAGLFMSFRRDDNKTRIKRN